jgi:DNA-binding IclR family transcriptional regulator
MSSLSNALALLSAFSRSVPELGVSELALKLDMPKSSVSRLMAELERAGYLERTEGRRYRPGPELMRIGSLYKFAVAPIDRIDTELKALVARFPATAYVAINKGLDTMILRMREGTSLIRFVVPEGSVIPAFTVAIGKAILARRDDTELQALLPARAMCDNPFYEKSKAELLAELLEGRARGWLELHDMAGRGVQALAIAIKPAGGDVIGLAFSFMSTTLPEIREEMLEALMTLGKTLGVALGDDYWRQSVPHTTTASAI